MSADEEMTDMPWFYVETIDADGRRVPNVIQAEARTVALRIAGMDHRARHPSAGWVEVAEYHPIDRDKADDIRRYMARGEWKAWPLGVPVPM